ncbi:UDP-glucuronosyltransferase [Caenorhabditis elegans]|uniref:UDP-glucuronosyltransferase n=1 Tax=Caenorhabditis elegans TaxID=6239 RepID=B1Q250_CAEEL|nr:UDP-glucuronosyltransferase [Caenorhabditis elegans]CCD64223.1 UDP-glucuronosyltransferase [Caenorhabditis elegans]|eukprot:NP_001122418.1 UDP-glucuronosyltransferase [Caenorhabditis elegans]
MIRMSVVSISLVLCTLSLVSSLNILVHSPAYAASHTNFMARLADTLTEAGHNTFLVPIALEERRDKLGVKLTKDVIIVEQDEEMKSKLVPHSGSIEFLWIIEMDSSSIDAMFSWYNEIMILTCENFMRNKQVMSELKSRHFDVAIAEPFTICGLGLFEELNIKKTILVSSCAHYDFMLPHIGEPEDFSSVPTLSSKVGEEMSMTEKWENYRLVAETKASLAKLFDAETRIYRESFGSDIPDWKELMSSASLYFTNSNPFIDYPRASIQKTISIGGITVDFQQIKSEKLNKEWEEVLNKRQKSMLISFGSNVPSDKMPAAWKAGIFETIKSMPNVTFIWKYESDDVSFADGISNIHFSKWVPQTALLNDPRLSAFLTHGGLGSTNELAYCAKPAVMVPIYGDQTRNANMLARHGSVIVLHKKELANVQRVKKAVHDILYNKQYTESAERIAEMIKNQPKTPKETVVRYTEFVAKYGPFPQMAPHGRKLTYFQKTFLDIYSLFALGVVSVLTVAFLVIRYVLSCFKLKKD